MFRLSGLFSLALAVLCGTMLFWTSQSVQRAERDLSKMQMSTSHEVESLRVLSAEWDYLNRPQRLEKLAQDNLSLDKGAVEKLSVIGGVDAIPQPMVPAYPKMKPENLMFNVSMHKKKVVSEVSKSPVIKKPTRQNFDNLLNGITSEDIQ